ncbi:5-formyltetrahydrofolate cyclo-ligase [Haliea sp. E17]|uniref:5-formyltetrahydrofolate cyclo-ligase n=1 Tax=Haliea sp. E17 TaxID=3401576 RepID=UPI003AAEB3FF
MTSGTTVREGRWSGRHSAKDALRQRVWETLEREGYAVGNPFSAIPDFVGAEVAALQLAMLPFWQSANIVKCNPDRGQGWVRLQALKEGKRVYTPVPELTADFPFIHLDPSVLRARGIAFDDVMYSEGALAHGERVEFEAMAPMDICVVGCVAVSPAGGRTGKGAGFADLEMGIFRELQLLAPDTPVVTTVHEAQVVADEDIVMQAHDTPLDWIITPARAIETRSPYPAPGALDWSAVQPDQFTAIPFLSALRARLSA